MRATAMFLIRKMGQGAGGHFLRKTRGGWPRAETKASLQNPHGRVKNSACHRPCLSFPFLSPLSVCVCVVLPWGLVSLCITWVAEKQKLQVVCCPNLFVSFLASCLGNFADAIAVAKDDCLATVIGSLLSNGSCGNYGGVSSSPCNPRKICLGLSSFFGQVEFPRVHERGGYYIGKRGKYPGVLV